MSPEELLTLLKEAADAFAVPEGKPTDDDITRIYKVLYPLLLSIPYDQEAGRHNLRGLITPKADYIKKYGVSFRRPPRPATYSAAINATTSDAARRMEEAKHTVLKEDHNLYLAGERGTKAFLTTIVDKTWYRELERPDTYYAEVTAMDIMDHLRKRSGGLHAIDAIDLLAEMGSYYAESTSILEYINKLETGQKKALRAKFPISDDMLVAIATKAVLADDAYPRTTEVWEELDDGDKTWLEWKDAYINAFDSRERRLQAAGEQGGNFGSANAATALPATSRTSDAGAAPPPETFDKLDAYLDNMSDALANAATVGGVNNSSLDSLVESLATAIANCATLTATNARLVKEIAALRSQKRDGTQAQPTPRVPRTPTAGAYCWTHGYKCIGRHCSKTCNDTADGHQRKATRENTMGGSTLNKGWDA